MVPLPPPPSKISPIPHTTNTNPSQAGAAFGRRVSCSLRQSIDNSVGHISALSINVQSYNGSIFLCQRNLTRLKVMSVIVLSLYRG